MSHYLGLSAVLLVCLAVTAYSQTFQYSRGWTNGKRRVAEMPLVGVPLRASNDHRALDEVLSKFVSYFATSLITIVTSQCQRSVAS